MKIAFVTNNFEPIISGITTSINCFYMSLIERGHHVYIIAPEYPKYSDNNLNIYRVFSIKLYYKEKYPIPIISSITLAKIMRELSIDIIHSHHPFGLGLTALKTAKKHLKIPIVFTYHTMYEDYSHYIPLPNKKFLQTYIKYAAINYSNKCNCVITPSESLKKLLFTRGCKKTVQVIPSGISKSLIASSNSSKLTRIKKNYGIKEKDIVFLCVSRLAKEKNCEFLIKSFSKVKIQMPKAKLLIVGNGPTKKKLEQLVFKLGLVSNIILVGAIPHSIIADFYKIAQVLLFVSQTDTQGLPLIEALPFGLPIVAVESLASKEFVGSLNTGILTNKNEYDFSRAIIDLSAAKDLRGQYSAHNKKIAEKFCLEKLSKKMENLYKSISYN